MIVSFIIYTLTHWQSKSHRYAIIRKLIKQAIFSVGSNLAFPAQYFEAAYEFAVFAGYHCTLIIRHSCFAVFTASIAVTCCFKSDGGSAPALLHMYEEDHTPPHPVCQGQAQWRNIELLWRPDSWKLNISLGFMHWAKAWGCSVLWSFSSVSPAAWNPGLLIWTLPPFESCPESICVSATLRLDVLNWELLCCFIAWIMCFNATSTENSICCSQLLRDSLCQRIRYTRMKRVWLVSCTSDLAASLRTP